MIPLSADLPRSRAPVINILLIMTNALTFLLPLLFSSPGASRLYLRLGCIPYEITRFEDIGLTTLVPLPLTLVTTLFLHGGWLHLIGNLLFLFVFGGAVETRLGHLRYAAFYLTCGVLAVLIQVLAVPASRIPVVGASGAVAGVMAAFLVFHPHVRIKTLMFWFVFAQVVRIPAVVFLGVWVAVQFLAGLAQSGGAGNGVAWFAHLGGFSTGLLISLTARFQGK